MSDLDVKAQVRERDGYCCTVCGMAESEHLTVYGTILHVHRVTPGSAYTLPGCVTVCTGCHGSLPKRPAGYRVPPRVPRKVMLTISGELYDALAQAATDDDRSVSKMAELLLEHALKSHGRWNNEVPALFAIPRLPAKG